MMGKSLSEKVNRKIQFYLHNIKSRSSQNTLIAITKKANSQDKRFITITHKNNQCYAVHLKKEKFIQYTQNTRLCSEYKEIMLTKIKSEFESKIRHDAIVGGEKNE
jgi:GTP-binding protein EngB required for normal cell division